MQRIHALIGGFTSILGMDLKFKPPALLMAINAALCRRKLLAAASNLTQKYV
jgi:hypothetical protein